MDSDGTKLPRRAAARPLLFVLLIAAVACSSWIYQLRAHGIFACQARGYSSETYLAYCNATSYGEYDHGAFWLNLEPEARSRAEAADVLFLGNSRMQFGFSASPTEKWFTERDATYYLLGFTYQENETFTGPLINRMSPRAKAYVINVDEFFTDEETEPGAEVMHDAQALSHYRRKQLWQFPHESLCTTFAAICGRQFVIYRRRRDGFWFFDGPDTLAPSDVADGQPIERTEWDSRADRAAAFVASLPVRRDCIVLTIVPTRQTRRAEAEAIADRVGLELFAPKVRDLQTFDQSHLAPASADKWSRAFFDAAGRRISACLAEPEAPEGTRPEKFRDGGRNSE